MNCNFNSIAGLISLAIALLLAAIVISYLWVAAVPLFIAAGLVMIVSFGLIPAIKNALIAYQKCRGASDTCTISMALDTLGQVAATLSAIAFLAAAIMEVAALAFLYSWILSWLGVSIQVAVAFMVKSGQFACAIAILILLGVLTNAWSYKSCMDQQGQGGGGTGGGGVLQ